MENNRYALQEIRWFTVFVVMLVQFVLYTSSHHTPAPVQTILPGRPADTVRVPSVMLPPLF